jgi:hypothetical protein
MEENKSQQQEGAFSSEEKKKIQQEREKNWVNIQIKVNFNEINTNPLFFNELKYLLKKGFECLGKLLFATSQHSID